MLRVTDLAKGFDLHALGRRLAGLAPVSFDLEAGEMLRLDGPNGAGKSTLLRTLYRSYRAEAGRAVFASSMGEVDLVRAADADIVALRRADLGFVTQFLDARPRVSAEDLVAEPLVRAGQGAEALDRARAALDAFGLARDLWAATPATFSGGERQKVNLARATILPRRLLLLDEPTASLDAGARTALMERLAALKASDTAMIGVFHHPGDVAALIDRTLTLEPAHVAV